MSRFFFFIWLKWVRNIVLITLALACGFAFLITAVLYIKLGMPFLNNEIQSALINIFKFWLPITLSLSLLIALFLSIKYIFNRCIGGYNFKLMACDNADVIEDIRYQDLIKVFRKWLMLIIWLVGAQMIMALAVMILLSDYKSIFDWFDIYLLFAFIITAGYISFVLLGTRCKKVKVSRC